MQNKILLDVEIFRVNKINMTQNKQKKVTWVFHRTKN